MTRVTRTLPVVLLAAVLVVVMTLTGCGGGSPIAPNPNPPVTVPPPAPVVVNTPPVIESIAASVSRAEVGTDVALTAVVKDAETPIAQLMFEWTATAGTFTGSGPTVTWRAPTGVATPIAYTITLKVVENVSLSNGSASFTTQNSATSDGPSIRVHDSPKELGDLAVSFLGAFANSSVSASTCVKDFSDSCKGKADERADIEGNRAHFDIIGSSLRLRSASAASSGLTGNMTVACSFTSRITKCEPGDRACVVGAVGTVAGDCTLTAVYEQQRWWLCESHFTGSQVPVAFRSFLTPTRE